MAGFGRGEKEDERERACCQRHAHKYQVGAKLIAETDSPIPDLVARPKRKLIPRNKIHQIQYSFASDPVKSICLYSRNGDHKILRNFRKRFRHAPLQ
ncbi:hypothetical protein Y032_0714g1760 [Ancylostoma ceylanicum]|uniref:Uncharacterized protein n=1 Tax=Ancylostoma ceylanicum TaxID=53326 RepID=A0A016WF93_9BILA|nr:hypothetical protein Y032_0714g1760 [Ancylostoma ceylanicum]